MSNHKNLPLKWVSSFARSPSFQLRVLLLSSAVVFATRPMFDLNEPAAESWEEVTSYTDPTTTHPTSAVTSDMPSNKRNSNQVQLSSLSPPRIRPCILHAHDGPSSSGEVPLAQSKLNQSPSEGQQSTAVNDAIDGSGTSHVPIARDHLGASQASGSGSKVVQSSARIDVDTSETDSLLAIEKTQSAKSPAYGYFLPYGQVVEELLNKHSIAFRKQIKYLQARASLGDAATSKPSSRLSRKNRIGGERIAMRSDSLKDPMPKTEELSWLYNRLATLMYKLHVEFLSLFDVSTFDHRIQQERLLDWLDKQILNPDNSQSVLKLMKETEFNCASDDPETNIDDIQLKLIKYFSQERSGAHLTLHHTASHLLNAFRDQHGSE
ncbi:hypothetical protein PGT21_026620 [Puccinia graminis f. sp. tritici]|uniref:Uncharacterized protein n=1 Tax=Puccinia graminis f. sp. tritici TaxID=56615 RepID=A0A5B0S1W4_PUCGR|nr:hypothetical protein PGT21_026620 [Puccinia graminis f. sp. tritici]KAA1131003.1 hypothetical protein PGTUg99_024411 [Puccinia graminis f. sp. tritici]